MTKELDRKAFVKIYLAHPFFNEHQKEMTKKALALLEQNDTVSVVHEPFTFQYHDVSFENDPEGIFGSLQWAVNTYQNDLSAMASSDCAVVLWDMDNEDPGTAYEVGFMRAMQKPVVIVPFSKGPNEDYELNLMLAVGATTFIDGNHDFDKLKTFNFNHFPSEMTCPFPVF